MSEIKLGHIIESIAERDAIHVAVAPVEAAGFLKAGQHVGLRDGKAIWMPPGDGLGIVDPYLTKDVNPGERFWLFLYPNTVTGMRHHWAHPAFGRDDVAAQKNETPKQAISRAWLTDFAKRLTEADRWEDEEPRCVLTYEDMLEAGKNRDFCLPFDTPDFVWDESEMFWHHYGVVTGDLSRNGGHSPFRCAC